VQLYRQEAGCGSGRDDFWLHVCVSNQEREAATCSMKLAKLMSRSDKPPHSWVLKVM